MFCNKCGAQLEDNAVFCGNCGTPVAAVPGGVPAAKPKNGMAIASMVVGICSIFLGSLAGAVVAIVLACVSLKKRKSGFAVAGLITGILGCVVSVFMLVKLISTFNGIIGLFS